MLIRIRPAHRSVLLALAALMAPAGCSSLGSSSNSALSASNALALFQPGEKSPHPVPGSQPTRNAVEQATAVSPETRQHVQLAMGQILESAGKLQDAESQYEEALKADPKSLDALLATARIYTRTGRYDAALDVYKRAEKHHPKDPSVYNDKALCLAEQKQWDAAVATMRQAIKIDPRNSKYHNNLGLVLASSGQHEEAWKAFREAVGPAMAHYNLAVVLLRAGQPSEARDHLDRALAIMPQLEQAQALLARMEQQPKAPAKPTERIAELPVKLELLESTALATDAAQKERVTSPTPPAVATASNANDPWSQPRVQLRWLD